MTPPSLAADFTDKHDRSDLLTAQEASRLLGVKQATLYTYVSRGWLHPVKHPGRKGNRYLREEVESLKVRSTVRQGHGAVAAAAMRWGQPVIDTTITQIDDQGPRYRGHLASDLVLDPGAFENVAELLWSGVLTDTPQIWPVETHPVDLGSALQALLQQGARNPRMMRVFSMVAIALGGGTLAEELRTGSIERLSRQMLFGFAGACGILGPQLRFTMPQGERPIAQHILLSMGVTPTAQAEHAVNAALILGADHELSSGTFSARIAASTGSTLYASIVAALATQQGATLAGGADAAEDLIAGIDSVSDLEHWIASAELRRQRMVGFGLPIYPQCDPRARQLIELAQQTAPGSKRADLAYRFVESVSRQLGLHPNIEMGLVVLCIAWGLPARSPCALWGIGRSAGWIAHVMEQRLAGFTIRPRGLYQHLR
jgi:citrate synthase